MSETAGSDADSMEVDAMTAPLTKNDIEDALRRVLDAHARSPWFDTEAAAIYLSSTPSFAGRMHDERPRK